MHSTVWAVEAYRRTRLIDGVTSDEDKIAPVYRLEEICQVIRSSPLDIVREMLEHTLRRLDHKSPIVKQKTLRFMRYAAAKGGLEFKREMQRQAGVVRALFHYRGHPDPLKGDALNKAVRDTAHETIAAIFGSEEKVTTMEDLGKRIQGFGNSHYEKPREEEKKSVLSGLIGFGSESIRQSIDMINTYNNYVGSGSGDNRNSLSLSNRSQGLRRSLTAERERPLEKEDGRPWNIRDAESDDARPSSSPNEESSKSDGSNGKSSHKDGVGLTVEDRLLDSLTTPGGVRLQLTRETLQAFKTRALKLDAMKLVNALETKLKAHNWQVRFKALCLLEASIKQRENNVLDSVKRMFEEDSSAVVDSLQSPQVSLRDKARKVLNMLGGGSKDASTENGIKLGRSSGNPKPDVAGLPDLLDTRDLDFNLVSEGLQTMPAPSNLEQTTSDSSNVVPVQHDLFGDWLDATSATVPEADPFAGMSFHSADNVVGNGTEPDLFSGLDLDKSRRVENGAVEGTGRVDHLFDHPSESQPENKAGSPGNLENLMGSLFVGAGISTGSSIMHGDLQSLVSSGGPMQQPVTHVVQGHSSSGSNVFQTPQPQAVGLPMGIFHGGDAPPQMFIYPPGSAQYLNGFSTAMPRPFPANPMLQQNFGRGAMNLAGMNSAFSQQQFPAGSSGVPLYTGNLQTSYSSGGTLNHSNCDNFDFSGDAVAKYGASLEDPKKEDTKAFDFISDHVSSQLGHKKST